MMCDLSEIREKGFKALTKELGASGMAIFIRQFDSGKGDYTTERRETLKDISIDEIVSSIKKRNDNG